MDQALEKTNTPIELDSAQLKSALDADKRRRADACNKDLIALMEKYNCRLVPVMIVTPAGVDAQMRIEAL